MTKKSKIYAFGYNAFRQTHPEIQDAIIGLPIDITAFADKIIWANMNSTLSEKSIKNGKASTVLLAWGFDSVENKIISPTCKSWQRVKKCFGNDNGILGFLDIDGNIHFEGEYSGMHEISNSCTKIVDVSQFWTGNAMIVVTVDGKLYNWNIEQVSSEEITPIDNTIDLFFTKVVCGENHCLALTRTGQVFSWGSGRYGQLGHGDTKSLDKPKVIEFFLGLRVVQIACGGWHSAVITGDLYTFGWNHLGRLGIPPPDKNDHTQPMINYAEPTLIELNEGKDFEPNIIKVSCGSAHTAIVTDDYRLWTCGWGKYGQQGQGPHKLFDNLTFTPSAIKLCQGYVYRNRRERSRSHGTRNKGGFTRNTGVPSNYHNENSSALSYNVPAGDPSFLSINGDDSGVSVNTDPDSERSCIKSQANDHRIPKKRTLLHLDQNYTIQGLSCQTDFDCNNSSNNPPVLGNYLCAQNRCKFVVAAGQPCHDVSDCSAYYYYSSVSQKLPNDIDFLCSASNEKLESICGNVWENFAYLPNFTLEGSRKFCGGIPLNESCSLVATDVDPCDYSLQCVNVNSIDNVKRCENVNSSKSDSVILGVFICLTGNIILNIGLNVQKFAFTRGMEDTNLMPTRVNSNPSVPSTGSVSSHKWYKKFEKLMFWKQIVVSPLWVMGLLIYIGGTMMGFVALKFAPQSLVAPLGAISLITNLLIAPILHKQKLVRSDIIGVVIIVGGCVMITFVPGDAIQGCFIILLYLFIRVVEKRIADQVKAAKNASNRNSIQLSKINLSMGDNNNNNIDINITPQDLLQQNRFFDSLTSSQHIELQTSDTSDKISDILNNNENIQRQERILLPIAYAILASSMATMTTLFAKSLINLLSESLFHDNNQFKDFSSWIILIVTLVTAFGQVYWLNMGLKKYDALIQVPIFFCNWTIFDIIGGGIYYDEFRSYSIKKYAMFIVGVLLIFFGVGMLSKRLASLSKEEEDLYKRQLKLKETLKLVTPTIPQAKPNKNIN
ncbi:24468_t:CDS:10 [Cetraspora pellucida]|uniref:24468_t:CDS:1 n=1 Tax=Cetraspora pellucida TaxID=1433469 RepID=A0A9N9CE82_9GLOM|nr:24468_t:CDS:10 [Cetraspora pellucida]